MSVVIAIDAGTTGVRSFALRPDGSSAGYAYREFPQHFPAPGLVEHDPDDIWEATTATLADLLERLDGEAVAAVGITNQRETTVVWDRRGGRPLHRALVWQDRRTADRCEELAAAGHLDAVRRRTGLVLDPYFSATKLEWMLRHQSGLRAQARRGRLAFGTVDTWLLWKLTGGQVHATDPTNASRTLLYHIGRHEWDERLLETFGVPPAVLPRVLPSSGIFGTTRGLGVLPDGIPISGIAGDQQAALFGQGCVAPGQSKNTYGTGCFLLLHTGKTRVASRSGLVTTVACGPDGEPAYALEGSVFIAGAALQWLRDGLQIIESASASEALARSVPDSGGVVMLPAFVGLGAPYWRPEVRGALFGLTRGTSRAHVVRATLESLAFQTRDLIEAMARDAGGSKRGASSPQARRGASRRRGVAEGRPSVRGVRVLKVDGGAAANDFLMQYQADLLGIRVERPRVIETTALGAGLLAGLGTGFWSSHRDLDRARRIERVFEPGKPRRWRDEEYARWQRAVNALLAM
jgi:glycerol kinase